MTIIDRKRPGPGHESKLPAPSADHGAPAFAQSDDLDPVVHDRRWVILGVLCLSLLIIVMDNTILNVAIPSLITELGASNSQIQWIIDSYVIVFAGLLLTAGSLSDRFGRKGALQIGIVLFGLGSSAAALSGSANQLIAARAFMGIGGALIMPATLSILTNVFRDPKERGRAIAVWAGFSGLGVAIGPMAGGFLLEHYSWHSVFCVNLPLGATALLLGAFFVPTSRDPKQGRLDPLGAGLSIVGLAAFLYGIIEGPANGWTHSTVLAGFAIGVLALGAFVAWEFHTDTPMLDMSVFKNARFSAASGTVTMVFFALFGSLFLMTQYWQLVHGYTPLEAGVRLLPQAFTMMIVAPLSARLVERAGTKRIVLSGLVLIMIGMTLLSFIAPTTPYVVVISFLIVMSAGMGMTMAPATESIMGSLPREKAGVGSAINDTTRQVGGALGVAIVGSAVSSVYAGRITDVADSFDLGGDANAIAQDSLGGAQRVATGLGAQADRFLDAANQTFVDSMSIGFRLGVVVVFAAALMAWRYLPAHAADGPLVEWPDVDGSGDGDGDVDGDVDGGGDGVVEPRSDVYPGVVSAPGGSPSVVGSAAPAGASFTAWTPASTPTPTPTAAPAPTAPPAPAAPPTPAPARSASTTLRTASTTGLPGAKGVPGSAGDRP